MHRSSSSASHVAKIMSQVENDCDPSALVSSWRRCLSVHQLRPDGAIRPARREHDSIVEACQSSEAMVRAAIEPMEYLLGLSGGSDLMVFLANIEGVVVETRSLRTSDFWDRPRGDWIGTDFGETSHGTNGVGTVLRDKRPMTISADEHFHVSNAAAVCSGAPIYGVDGTLAGCIDVSSGAANANPIVNALMLAATIEAAKRIERRMLAHAFSHAKLVLASQTGQHSGATLAVDRHGGVVGATRAARMLLDLKPEQLRGHLTVEQLWDCDDAQDLSYATAERRAIEAALARHLGNASAAARALGISRSTLLRKIAAFEKGAASVR